MTALPNLADNIIRTVDTKIGGALVSIDYSKAFENKSQKLLIVK